MAHSARRRSAHGKPLGNSRRSCGGGRRPQQNRDQDATERTESANKYTSSLGRACVRVGSRNRRPTHARPVREFDPITNRQTRHGMPTPLGQYLLNITFTSVEAARCVRWAAATPARSGFRPPARLARHSDGSHLAHATGLTAVLRASGARPVGRALAARLPSNVCSFSSPQPAACEAKRSFLGLCVSHKTFLRHSTPVCTCASLSIDLAAPAELRALPPAQAAQ